MVVSSIRRMISDAFMYLQEQGGLNVRGGDLVLPKGGFFVNFS